MTFDPVRMTWVGGYEDMPDFGPSADSSPLKDDGMNPALLTEISTY